MRKTKNTKATKLAKDQNKCKNVKIKKMKG